jgi:hypothetical protein
MQNIFLKKVFVVANNKNDCGLIKQKKLISETSNKTNI